MGDALSSIMQRIQLCKESSMLIAVDGRCASGKTTLAALLKESIDCNVIHMDHFFLRPEQRTSQRMEEPGGNVDYERFKEEVMLPLSRKEAFSYQVFDCKKMELSSFIQVPPAKVTIVEGSYSCHPTLWDFYYLHVFLKVGKEEQLQRIRRRNGEEAVSQFVSRWIPLEEKYFNAFQIQERCELVF